MSENKEKTKRKAPPHAWKAGQTGNPGGRPKRTEEEIDLIAACKDKTGDALAVLTQIMNSGENERNRITAAMAIIERGHGKAVQPTTLSSPNGGPVDMNWSIEFIKPKDEGSTP